MSLLNSALKLARAGYRVFPLEPNGKKPLIEKWQHRATTDEAAIGQWWGRWPSANPGIATGHGLLVVDADCKDGKRGMESLELMDTLGMLPETYRVRTTSGGVHVYLRVAPDAGLTIAADDIEGFPGIDYRCDGGFVVGEGAVVDGVAYAAF